MLLANSLRGDTIRGNEEKGPAIEETKGYSTGGLIRKNLKGSSIDEPPKNKPSRDSPRDRPGSTSSISERQVSTCRCAMNWEASMTPVNICIRRPGHLMAHASPQPATMIRYRSGEQDRQEEVFLEIDGLEYTRNHLVAFPFLET
jgi:hypothetical protein